MTPMTHIYLSNIVLPEHRFVKSPTLVRLKTRVWIQWNPVKFDSKFPGQETCSPTRYQIWEKKISLRRKFSASDGLAEHPDTIVTNVFSVPLPCSYKTQLTPVAGSFSDHFPHAQSIDFISKNAWSPDFTSFIIQVISWAKFYSAQGVCARSIERFHFEESRLCLVPFGKETVNTSSTNVLSRVKIPLLLKIFSNEITCIRNEVKSGNQAVFEMKSLDWACGKRSENESCYRCEKAS